MGDTARPNRLDAVAIAERRRKVASLYLEHHQPQAAIARVLNVSPATVCTDLAALLEEWRAENREELAAVKAREAAELDAMEAEAARQYAQTKGVEWFDRRLKVKVRRARLLGLDAPAKTDVGITVHQKAYLDYPGDPETD